jgi:hypothetical protein
VARTWILTGSPENYEATKAHGFTVIGLKERNRGLAEQIRPRDRIVFYITGVKAFAGSIRIEGTLYEDRSQVWRGKPGRADAYPWRFPTSADVVLDEGDWIPADSLAEALDHVAKWPREHWTLAFQGQIRPVSEHDAHVLLDALGAAAGVPA